MAKTYSGVKKPKTRFAKWWGTLFGRLFCKRSIIIISEHRTQHVPFAIGAQMFAMVGALVMVGWASYSSGSYMAAQQVLKEKDRKIATTAEGAARTKRRMSSSERAIEPDASISTVPPRSTRRREKTRPSIGNR
jgi:hypothetical protein